MIRWAVPAAALAVVAGAAFAPRAVAEPALPPKTAEQLLVDLQNQQTEALSGTVQSRTDLGLPPLPVGTDADFAALTSGTHTLRVWQSGETKARVSLVDTGAEATIIRNGSDVWQWSSTSKKATHTVLGDRQKPAPDASSMPATPQEAAREILSKVEPTTAVTVSGTESVAGRAAYELVLDPKSQATLVDRVTIAVDAENNAPLRVEAWPTGAGQPAVRVGFTEVDFSAPDDSVFRFNPPAGTTVEELQPKTGDQAKPEGQRPEQPKPTTVGDGWDAVTITTMPELPANTDPNAERESQHSGNPADWQQLRDSLPTVQGPWGSGKVITSALVTVVITDDGRVAMGMVPTERVVAAIPR